MKYAQVSSMEKREHHYQDKVTLSNNLCRLEKFHITNF